MSADDVASPRKIALVLAGGGVTGAVYEIGALRALDDLLDNRSVTDFDIFVGTSAGALVCAGLANGLTPREMMRHLEGPLAGLAPLGFGDLFALDGSGLLRHGLRLPEALLGALRRLLDSGGRLSLLDTLEALGQALPGGLYDSSALEAFVAAVLARPGLTNDFRTLRRELAIIATELDTGERVVFGAPPHDHVPIARAVAASAAMPLVYRPVRIDGRDYIDGGVRGNASLDLAIERGARLIVCINPLVPFDQRHARAGGRIADLGAPAVAGQTFRTFAHAGLHYHLKQIRRTRPDVDVLLIEPARDDTLMFSEMPMRYAARLAVARHGYHAVAARLAERYDEHATLFARHGVHLRLCHADQQPPAGRDGATLADTRRLRAALAELEMLIAE
jgi:NTE family protein